MKKALWKANNSRLAFGLLVAGLVLFRLLLSHALLVCFSSGSYYDDLMQINKAMSVANGGWLGGYGSLTLVKGVGFPLLTAVFHWLHLPYIWAYQLLYILAASFFMWAVAPVVKNKWAGLLAYAFVLYNPIAFSAQITRLYRDIGYYSLAFLCISFALGLLLRYKREKQNLFFVFGTGFFLVFCATFREDSQWLFVYVGCVFALYAFLRFFVRKGFSFKKLASFLLVFALGWALYAAPISLTNYLYYGTFALDEYNSGAFARAYGALTRIDNGTQDSRLALPEAQRMQLYALSPAFAELKEVLDGPNSPYAEWKAVQGEYLTGYFSFVLRDAAASIGKYESAQTANEYFTRLANEVNEVCDAGLIAAGPRRSGITARYYPWMNGPIVTATRECMVSTLRCGNISPIPLPANEDDALFAHYENFTYSTIAGNRYMPSGEIVDNYHFSGWQLFLQRAARAIVFAYSLVLPLLFAAACLAFFASFIFRLVKKTLKKDFVVPWLAAGSLLAAFVLRCFMIAFVQVSSFSVIGVPSYEAAGYPVLLAFIALTALLTLQPLLAKKPPAPEV
ncbi:MAG: hypothetical protein ACK5L3_03030 [Oscillospiraceae bacterium]